MRVMHGDINSGVLRSRALERATALKRLQCC
jgi:hypothetical protein